MQLYASRSDFTPAPTEHVAVLYDGIIKAFTLVRCQVVCARADAISARGIVLAKHNRGVVADFFLGSVTSYCSENARQAVIVYQ